jgi:hypothetical protein
MPFAKVASGVALTGKQLGDRNFPPSQSVRQAGARYGVCAASDRVTSGHDGRAAWRALGLHIKVEEAHAFAGELVDARRGRAGQNAAAVDAQLAIAKIIHQDENDVGLFLPCRICPSYGRRQYGNAYKQYAIEVHGLPHFIAPSSGSHPYMNVHIFSVIYNQPFPALRLRRILWLVLKNSTGDNELELCDFSGNY